MFNKYHFSSLIVIVLLGLFSGIYADEGMWVLDQLNQLPLKEMKSKGLVLSPEQIYNSNGNSLADAIVQVGGGTGSFVSARGLILTNHHVAFDALQAQSSVASDYIQEGFLANTLQEEIVARQYRAKITKSFKDVTDQVLAAVNDKMSYSERYEALEKRKNELVQEAEASMDVSAEVVEMLSATRYYIFTYFELKDIRIVYAPPLSVGNYGEDVDNFMWPRHTGDFSFLRAYVGPDGKPAEYSEKNVPYTPQKYLKLSVDGIQEGDFTMVIGYPGNTFRYRSSYSIDHWQNNSLPTQIDFFKTAIKTLEDIAGNNRDLQIKFADDLASFNNVLKYNQGMLEGLKKAKLLARKQKQEKELTQFLQQNPELNRKYGHVLPEIEKVYQELRTFQDKQTFIGFLNNVALLNFAAYIYEWSLQKEKAEVDRKQGFGDRQVDRAKKGFELAQQDLYIPADKKAMEILLLRMLELPEGQKVAAVEKVAAGSDREHTIHQFVENLFANTRLGNLKDRMEMFDMSHTDLVQQNDAMIAFAAELQQESKPIEDKFNAFVGAVFTLRPQLIQAIYEWKKSALYPDANFTVRFTYGYVKGYSPADATFYNWVTTLKGVIEKDTGKKPFANPKQLAEIYHKQDFGKYYDKRIKGVPVNFLHDVDTTGGNSGSPVLNGKGELIGVIFDGNYEAMSSDFQYNPELTRGISVDIRYVLFITEKLGKATNLMQELSWK